MLDLHPASDDRFRVWSRLTKREGKPQVHTFDEDIKGVPFISPSFTMKKRWHGTTRKLKPGVGRQHGGIAPFLAAAIPALVAGGKAAAMRGLGAAANYGATKALHALPKQKYKRKHRPQRRTKARWRDVWHEKGPF